MTFLPDWWHREPVRFWGALVVFVNSVIALLVLLEVVSLTAPQLAGLFLVVLNAAVLLGGEAVRGRVSPNGAEPADEDGE
jgi:predicted tellurium resistance membrane protein TerC